MRPILFYLGPFPIRAYGLMLWVALMVGLAITLRAAKRTKIEAGSVVDIAFYSLLAGLLCAHIVSLLLNLPTYIHDPSQIIETWRGMLTPAGGLRGLSFHGGLIGAVGATFIYTRRRKLRFIEILDLFSPGLAVGYSIARIGCFLNGCCYGMPTNLPWAVRFHLDPGSPELTVPSHPTQIYASIASLVIFFLLTRLEKVQRYRGQIFFSYLAMYSVYRFLIEFLRRGVTAEVFVAGLTQAQVASIAILLLALAVMWKLSKQTAKIGTEFV